MIMDAFDKLAKLAGASVESVGEGLPRTRKEAKALGVMRYFTGAPCPHGHMAERYTSVGSCIECLRQRSRSSDVAASKRIFDDRHAQRSEHKRNAKSAKDKELFAISQAIRAAKSGVFKYDITEFCEESTRIKLQRLIDKVKNDKMPAPEVLDILRTMRELRKVELAELAVA